MVTNGTTYYVAGLQRSGNHGIINWILSNQKPEGRVALLNNVECYSDPFETAQQNLLRKYTDGLDLKTETIVPTVKEALVVSYEDRFLSECLDPENIELVNKAIGESEITKKVLILRDPFNFFASRYISEKKATKPPVLKNFLRRLYYQMGQWFGFERFFFKRNTSSMGRFFEAVRVRLTDNSFGRIPLLDVQLRRVLVNLYKEYCKYFLAENDTVCINFSLWHESGSYRISLAQELGLNSHEFGIEDEAVYSNFDNRIAPNERWKVFKDDRFYTDIFKDEELIELSKRVFGEEYVSNIHKQFHTA